MLCLQDSSLSFLVSVLLHEQYLANLEGEFHGPIQYTVVLNLNPAPWEN